MDRREREQKEKKRKKEQDRRGSAGKPSGIDGDSHGVLPPGIMGLLSGWAQLDIAPSLYLNDLISQYGDPHDPNDGSPDGNDITEEDVFNRTLGPLIRTTNPFLDASNEGTVEDAFRLKFGAAPVDPAGPDEGIMSGPRPRPEDVLPSSDPKAAGTARSAFAPGQPKANALNQMEDEWR